MTFTWNYDRFLELIKILATTPGPSLAEAPRAQAITSFLQHHQLPVRFDDAGNVWSDLKPGPWHETIIYDAHIDVVGPGVADNVIVTDQHLIAPGIADNLAAVTFLLLFAAQLKNYPLKHPFSLLFSVGEEGLGNLRGMHQMLHDHPTPSKLFISWDLSYDVYSLDAVGSARYELQVKTPGGHSWANFGTPNAAELLVTLLTELKDHYQHFARQHQQFISYNLGSITGGTGVNCIADHAAAAFEYRCADPQLLNEMARQTQALIAAHHPQSDINITLTSIGNRPAGKCVLDQADFAPIAQVWHRQGVSLTPKARSTNINLPLAHKWPAVCLGLCKGCNIHRLDETLDIASLPQGWQLLTELTQALNIV